MYNGEGLSIMSNDGIPAKGTQRSEVSAEPGPNGHG